jgi:hypothetical protein
MLQQPSTVVPIRKEVTTMNTAAPAKPANPVLPALTVEQKAQARNLLDRHFNDATGQYSVGESDQTIAAKVGVPWAMIASLREAAYGPLRGDPEIDTLRAMIKAEKASISAAVEAFGKREQSLNDMERRLEAIARKYIPA